MRCAACFCLELNFSDLSVFPIDEELQSRQRTIDDLSRQLIEIRTALHEKGNATAELDKRVCYPNERQSHTLHRSLIFCRRPSPTIMKLKSLLV